MAKIITETMIAMRLAPIRVLFYFLSPCVLAFITLTEGWKQAVWDAMGAFERCIFWVKVFSPGIAPFLAFLDNTYNKAREERDRRIAAERLAHTPTPVP